MTPGRAWPLGAQVVPGGVNVAVHAPHATVVEVCTFDESGHRATARHILPGRTGAIWHGRLTGAGAGLVYGLRAHGPWNPARGDRFAPNKLLLDPWAREIVGEFHGRPEHRGEHPADNAPWALKARVVDDRFDWGDDIPVRHAGADLLICELHVKGFTMRHPGVPAELRGTYAGLASEASIAHLRRLGVTAVCLLPVHQHLDERHLGPLGLVNYWGYNTIGFFCPEPRYAAARHAGGGQGIRDEFRRMVQRLHATGIEVLLDVVYNHTAESDVHGPALSWRGLDNRAWYRLPVHDAGGYENQSGCGNTLDIRRPGVLRLVLDSLRHWVQEFHVDGFRFDLAPVLGRGEHGFDREAPFFQAVAQDPVLAGVRLIAEPWDVGHGGYRLGQFPPGWAEWNDRFRDTMRGFWLGHSSHRGEFAQRLSGSADVFRPPHRTPFDSINYVTAHDGFTLLDLVSHSRRHNHANGEDNRDGHGHNLSTNCGHEGPSDDPRILARRAALQRALLACTLLAQGTPMIAAGSELGHTQHGNNNAYCQDNELSWIDWEKADLSLLEFVAVLARLRRELLPLDGRWFDAADAPAHGRLPDLNWLQADGSALDEAAWHDVHRRDLMILIGSPGRTRQPLALLVNGNLQAVDFRLPPGHWEVLLDTARGESAGHPEPSATAAVQAEPHSVLLLKLHGQEKTAA